LCPLPVFLLGRGMLRNNYKVCSVSGHGRERLRGKTNVIWWKIIPHFITKAKPPA